MSKREKIDYLTTGQAAKVLGVTMNTVVNMLSSGRLKGFIVPGSRHRRISRVSVLDFLDQSRRYPEQRK